MVGCWKCTYPSIHFFVSRSRSVVWQAYIQVFTLKLPQDHGRLTGEHISKQSLFSWRRHSQGHGRLSGVRVVCVHVVLCVVLVVCVLLCCEHCTKHWSTNTAANIEAFECDLAHGRCTAVGSLPPPLPSLLPSLPPLLKKKRENFFLQEYFRRGIYFYYSFLINSKKSPPGEITGVTVLY